LKWVCKQGKLLRSKTVVSLQWTRAELEDQQASSLFRLEVEVAFMQLKPWQKTSLVDVVEQ